MEARTQRKQGDGVTISTLAAEVTGGPQAGRVARSSGEELTVGSAEGNDLRIDDRTVSRFHATLRSVPGGIEVVDLDSTNGVYLGGARILRAVVPPGTALKIGDTTLRVGEGQTAELALHPGDGLGRLHGRSAPMRRLMALVERAAATDASVLIQGESGTGKELVAESLHSLGPRRNGPFVTVDCGALTPTLVASELFGHERGAFTGAERQYRGAFERADGGTIFLDEIGELPAALQPVLLGVLQRKRLRRLGGTADIPFDARVVCATHRDLRTEINAGTFRLDLFYRLAVVRLSLPALRERREDIPLLVEHFVRDAGYDGPVHQLFSEQALAQLALHAFPGNVRELRNVVEAALAMGEHAPELLHDAQAAAREEPSGPQPWLDLPYREARSALLEGFEKRYLKHWLGKMDGNVSRTAREARIDRSHLNDLLRRHGLR